MANQALRISRSPTVPLPLGIGRTPLRRGSYFHGRYTITRELGAGALGSVYQAWDRERNGHVALKIANSPEFEEFLLNERIAAAGLMNSLGQPISPYVAGFYGAGICHGESGSTRYLVFEFVKGVALYNKISEEGKVPASQALKLICQICQGLRSAAERGIYHFDLKPGNIMLREQDGAPVLIDWGISFFKPTPKKCFGTFGYMSPEQMRSEAFLDHRSDIFALGAVFYEMTTGKELFPDYSGESLMEKMAGGLPETPEVPSPVRKVIKKMTAMDANRRYQSYNELLASIEKTIASLEAEVGFFRRTFFG